MRQTAIFTSRSRRVDLCTCLKEEIVEAVEDVN